MMNNNNEGLYAALAVAPAPLTMFGVPLSDWMYIASITVSVLYIVDKLPQYYRRIRRYYNNARSQ